MWTVTSVAYSYFDIYSVMSSLLEVKEEDFNLKRFWCIKQKDLCFAKEVLNSTEPQGWVN